MGDDAPKEEKPRIRKSDAASVGASLATVVALLYGGRDVSQKLDGIQATLGKVESRMAVIEAAGLDARVRALELGGVKLEARIDALEGRTK